MKDEGGRMKGEFLGGWGRDAELLLLDGPLGTRLQTYGFEVDRPGWSARALVEAPDLVRRIHQEYLDAGSRLLTANTFRTHQRNLDLWGQRGKARELTRFAVELARQVGGNRAWVAGSIAPLEDCYSPEQTPETDSLRQEHAEMVEHLVQAGVDVLLLETHVSWQELRIAAEAAAQYSLPLLISVTSQDGLHMLDGTPLAWMAAELQVFRPVALGLNCLPAERVEAGLRELSRSVSGDQQPALLVYANSAERTSAGDWVPSLGADLEAHTALAAGWCRQGVRLLGGCCGTTPELIANFSRHLLS